MDGAFRPNDRLDAAAVDPRDAGARRSGRHLARPGRLVRRARCSRVDKPDDAPSRPSTPRSARLPGLPDGGAAVGLADGRIVFVGGQHDGKTIAAHPKSRCITALAPARDGALLVANGSATNGPADWKRDLMEKNASGSVWRIEPATRRAHATGRRSRLSLRPARRRRLRRRLRKLAQRADADFPGAGGRSDAGAGRPSRLSQPAVARRRRRDLARPVRAAQPARRIRAERRPLSPAHDQRDRPRLLGRALPSRRAASPLEPTQQGGVRQLGVLKPWSPSRSYGLVARLDAAYRPIASFHSRANGRRHGVTSCLAHRGTPLLRRQGRRGRRLIRRRGSDAMTAAPIAERRSWR